MYKSFFQLARSPFELTPDPAFLFATRRHNEALATLYYGVREHKGFVVVTGEVGTGKTLMLRCLLKQLEQRLNVSYAYIFNSLLTPTEFLQYVLADLGRPAAGKNKAEMLFDLSNFLISRSEKGLTTALIVDEAHHLSAELLEEIRLLTNLETAEQKLLQVVLVGQPELDQKLDSIELRQLKQRIALRASLNTLEEEETKGYIWRRLQIAGANGDANRLFTEPAMGAVYRYSKGTPRLINSICENALITAYARQMRSITPEVIDDVANDLRLDVAQLPTADKTNARRLMDLQRATRTM